MCVCVFFYTIIISLYTRSALRNRDSLDARRGRSNEVMTSIYESTDENMCNSDLILYMRA